METASALRAGGREGMSERIEEYRSIVRNYQEQTWGIYDNTQDSELAIHVCDAYYGDSDSLAHKCEVLKKPVMIENVDV